MNVDKKIAGQVINGNASILTALKQMDAIDKKLLFVFDDNRFVNILSVGDIQRAIISSKPLDIPVVEVLRKNTKMCNIGDSMESIKEKMFEFRIECMPVLGTKGELADVIFWEDVFLTEKNRIDSDINLPVVIMAGGKGSRLKPITNVLPKPLIPIGDKTMIEDILDRFVNVGCRDFYMSVNYKADMIRHYFETLNNKNYNISYFQEEIPLGTAGGLHLLRGKIDKTFFVSNCDISIDENYAEILKYHRDNGNELTIVSALRHYPIPYGTIETGPNGMLKKITEKPELTFQINSGMYILEPKLLDEIPVNKFFHITNLIENIQKRNGKVGVFPVSEKSWKDIGNWTDYINSFKKDNA